MRNRFGPVKASVPPIGQGTWQLEHHHRSQVVAALGRGLELGLTHVDTAEMYGDGSVEEMVGEAIEGKFSQIRTSPEAMPRRVDVGSRVATQVQRGDEEFRLALVARGVIVVEDFDARRRQRPVRFHPLDDRVAHLDEPPHSGSLATRRKASHPLP